MVPKGLLLRWAAGVQGGSGGPFIDTLLWLAYIPNPIFLCQFCCLNQFYIGSGANWPTAVLKLPYDWKPCNLVKGALHHLIFGGNSFEKALRKWDRSRCRRKQRQLPRLQVVGQSGTSHLPWHLVPAFKPGETCVNEYTRRLEFLANVWLVEHLGQLAPRACLLCEGTAFQKVVRLDPVKLKVQSLDGIKLVVTTLGGVWGQSKTEHKYERFERALFGTIQKSDETHTSYIARHEVQYEDLLSLGATLEEMRAYILLRNSGSKSG